MIPGVTLSLRFPGEKELQQWLDSQQDIPLSYTETGATRDPQFPAGYAHDQNAALLGTGDEDFERAKMAIRQWAMFPAPWTKVPMCPEWVAGKVVAVMVRVAGIWLWNSCRIVYVIDEPDRYGLAYGTLLPHVEMGEEVFLVEKRPDGQVWYRVEAFSKPRFWGARLLWPVSRYLQRQFAHQSKAAMQVAVRRMREAAN
jgi:uncharacterized protein (UPF0548 family)